MMKAVLGLFAIAVACQAFLLTKKHECKTDGDCPNTHCCVSDVLHGEYCFHFQNKSQPCHLAGHTMHLYKCGCVAGHKCEQIHLGHGNPLTDPNDTLHHAEEILAHTGYGICVPSQT